MLKSTIFTLMAMVNKCVAHGCKTRIVIETKEEDTYCHVQASWKRKPSRTESVHSFKYIVRDPRSKLAILVPFLGPHKAWWKFELRRFFGILKLFVWNRRLCCHQITAVCVAETLTNIMKPWNWWSMSLTKQEVLTQTTAPDYRFWFPFSFLHLYSSIFHRKLS